MLSLMKNVLKPLAKSVLILLGLTAAASAQDAAIQEKIFGSDMTTLITSKEQMNEIMKTVNSLQESGLLMKSVSKTIKNEEKEQCYKIHYEIYKQVKSQLKQVKTWLEQARIFNAILSSNKFWNAKVLSKWT